MVPMALSVASVATYRTIHIAQLPRAGLTNGGTVNYKGGGIGAHSTSAERNHLSVTFLQRYIHQQQAPANRQENGTVAEQEGLTVPDCYRESRVLIVLQGDLLRKHDVAPGKISLRPKAPSGHLRAALIELIDVHHPVGANAVAFAGA
jgi:hypothetical protein